MAEPLDIYKVRILTTDGTQTGFNITHWGCISKQGNGATDAQIASGLLTALAPLYKPLLNANATFRGLAVQRIKPLPLSNEVADVSQSGAGTGGTVAMSTMTCGLIITLSPNGGRHSRGRLFIPFPSTSDDVSPGQPAPGYITKLQALGDGLILNKTVGSGGNTNLFGLVVYDRKSGVGTFITGYKTSPYWKVQRRRMLGLKGDVVPF